MHLSTTLGNLGSHQLTLHRNTLVRTLIQVQGATIELLGRFYQKAQEGPSVLEYHKTLSAPLPNLEATLGVEGDAVFATLVAKYHPVPQVKSRFDVWEVSHFRGWGFLASEGKPEDGSISRWDRL